MTVLVPRARAEAGGASPGEAVQAFLEDRCLECHDSVRKKGGLDLTELEFDLDDPRSFARWVAVHDRVGAGEMPPKSGTEKESSPRPRPGPAEVEAFTRTLAGSLVAAEKARGERE